MSEPQIEASLLPLEQMPPALRRFRQFTATHLAQVRVELRRIREEFVQARRNTESRVRDLRSDISGADEDDDTGWMERELEEAEDNLHRIERAERALEERIVTYEREAGRVAKLIESGVPRSEAFLLRKISALREIRAIQFEPACGGIGALVESVEHAALQTVASVGEAGNALADEVLDLTAQPLPTGYQWVRLFELDLDDAVREVQTPADFRQHASYDTMRQGLETLHTVVLPAIARRGYSADSFHFMREDRRMGQDYEHGVQRVFDAFFGNDPIAVQRNPTTGRFTVLNGRHRLRAASDSRWAAVPVKITGGNTP